MSENNASNNQPVESAGVKPSGDSERFLVFTLCEEQYAIPLVKVKEVIGLTDTTPMPYTPPHFLGILNLRGQVISIIDLRIKLKMKGIKNSAETTIVILDLGTLSIGVVVDSVESVFAVEAEDIQPPPTVESTMDSAYLQGVVRRGKDLIVLVDIEKTLNFEDLKTLQGHSKKSVA